MIEVSLLGPQAVRRTDGREFGSLPSQPKRFALLAYLALGAGGHHRRDALAAMFWPELDQFAARRALRNTLYHLREALGDGVIVTSGDEMVAIDPDALTCDVTLMASAFAAGRWEETVERYRGELLAGMHFVASGEVFEDWLLRERARVTAMVMRAIDALVTAERANQNTSGAAFWAQRACALAPGDETWVRNAMTLLDEADDRAGALRLYEAHVKRLAAEFDAAPGDETVKLATRIRGDTSARPKVFVSAPIAMVSGDSAVHDKLAADVSAPITIRQRAFPKRRLVASVGVVIVAAIAWSGLVRPAHSATHRARVLVVAFDNRTGDSSLQVLGRMAQDWLAQGLMGTQVADVVDPRVAAVQGRSADGTSVDPITISRRAAATMLVSGSYYKTGDTLLFQASVVDVANGRIIRAVGPIVAPSDEPLRALESLRSHVMTALATSVDSRFAESLDAGGEVPTFDAYQAYVEGWDAFWHGDGPHSERLFERAFHHDTSFVPAAVAAATSAANYHRCSLVDSIAAALNRRTTALPRVDRLTLDIAVAQCGGRNDEMLRLTLERADLEPGTSSLRMSAAAAALWANRPARALSLLERIDPATDLGWTTDTTHFAYWSMRTEALHLLGRAAEELAVADRVPSGAPLTRAWLRGRAMAAMSHPNEVLALIDSAMSLPDETENTIGLAPFTDGRPQYSSTPAWVAVWVARELIVHGDLTTARAAARRALMWYNIRSPEERATAEERLVEAWALDIAGDAPHAETLTRELVDSDSTNVDYRGELAKLAVQRADTADAMSIDRWLAAQQPDRVGWTALYYRACIATSLGHADAAVAHVRESLAVGAWPLWLHLDPTLSQLRDRRDFRALVSPRN
jgi:DNA-binding SARP family transcriptional activator/TolB-like protein